MSSFARLFFGCDMFAFAPTASSDATCSPSVVRGLVADVDSNIPKTHTHRGGVQGDPNGLAARMPSCNNIATEA